MLTFARFTPILWRRSETLELVSFVPAVHSLWLVLIQLQGLSSELERSKLFKSSAQQFRKICIGIQRSPIALKRLSLSPALLNNSGMGR